MALGPKKKAALEGAGVHQRLIEDLQARRQFETPPDDLVQRTLEHLDRAWQKQQRDDLAGQTDARFARMSESPARGSGWSSWLGIAVPAVFLVGVIAAWQPIANLLAGPKGAPRVVLVGSDATVVQVAGLEGVVQLSCDAKGSQRLAQITNQKFTAEVIAGDSTCDAILKKLGVKQRDRVFFMKKNDMSARPAAAAAPTRQ